jgi:hypothetical protein
MKEICVSTVATALEGSGRMISYHSSCATLFSYDKNMEFACRHPADRWSPPLTDKAYVRIAAASGTCTVWFKEV